MQEIEKEKQEPVGEREKVQRAEETASIVDDASLKTPIPESDSLVSVAGSSTQKSDVDVTMESQS